MAIFSAYFDASGNRRKSVLTVAGFVSRINKWTRFENEWEAILSRYGVTFFHMTDFVSSRGQFAAWRGKTDMRRNFVDDLVSCIKIHTNKGFAASVIVSDFEAVNQEFPLREAAGSPFALCARTCMGSLKTWAKNKNVSMDRVKVAFEKGDDDWGDFLNRSQLDGTLPIPLAKDETRAFQAADLAGWKTRTVIDKAVVGDVVTVEAAQNVMRSLSVLDGTLNVNGVFNDVALRRMCVAAGLQKRTTTAS